MKTILFTNARDENNILEWVIHHLNLGFTHVYIYDHLSVVPLKDKFNGLPVTVIRINDEIIRKTSYMKKSTKIATQLNFDWMIYLDCDEFLVLNHYKNVETFLNKYKNFNQIGINWLFFGSNYHDTTPSGTIMDNYTKSEGILDQHIKSFIKLPANIILFNPHVYVLSDMNKSVGTNFELLNSKTRCFFINSQNYYDAPAYIAHYVFQSYETYIKRKINLPRDDTGEFRPLMSKEALHSLYNQKETPEVRNKYSEINKKKMLEFINKKN